MSLRGSNWIAYLAGSAFAMGLALNFRSEFIGLVPIFALIVTIFGYGSTGGRARRFRYGLLYAFAAIGLRIPWSIFSGVQGSGVRMMSSNSGAISAITLGQLPDNPWGAVHDDRDAARILSALGHPGVDPFGAEGDGILPQYFFDSIADEPFAYFRKVAHNGRNIPLGGLYVGDGDIWVGDARQPRVAAIRERVKDAFGINPNVAEIEKIKEAGLWDDAFEPSTELAIVMAYGMAIMASNFLIALALLGLAVVVARRRFTLPTIVVGSVLIYVIAMSALLQYQPRHINAAIPALLVFAVAGTSFLRRRLLFGRSLANLVPSRARTGNRNTPYEIDE